MYIALDENNNRICIEDAEKGRDYFCPVCHAPLIIRDGFINATHFAHVSGYCEDDWNYDMSEWHLQWQAQFPQGNREVMVEHSGEKHRADVMACGYVIEFQHSPITAKEFEKRNEFYRSYGKKVVWIFNLADELDEGRIDWYEEWQNNNDNGAKYTWKYPKRFLQNYIPQNDKDIIVFFQFSQKDHTVKDCCYIERVIWAINEGGVSNFKRFFTSYYPGNAFELLDWIKNRKL